MKKITKTILAVAMCTMLMCNVAMAADGYASNWWPYGNNTYSGWSQQWYANRADAMERFAQYFAENNTEENDVEETEYEAPVATITKNDIGTCSRHMRLEWKQTEEKETKYLIRHGIKSDFSDAEIGEVKGNSTSAGFHISSGAGVYYFPAHCTYYFQVKAVYEDGESDWSDTVIAQGDR